MKRRTTGTSLELDTDSSGGSGGTVDQGTGNGGSSPWSVSGNLSINNSSSPYFKAALLTTVQEIKNSTGKLTDYYIYNPNDSVAYVQIFNSLAVSVILGTTVPDRSIGIPANAAANLAGLRLNFTTAISIAATTTATGNTAPPTGLDVNFGYE